jgi:hypothetical protein
VFRSGVLTIDPADLKITARDTTIVYGTPLEGLNFNYLLGNSAQGQLNITPEDDLAIVNAIRTARGTALVNGIGLVRGTALVNNDGDQLLTEDVLQNFSFMISQAVSISRGTALVNGDLIDPAELYQATAITNAQSRLVRGTALVNGFKLVRGTALVNTIDSLGAVTNTSSLDNAGSLVNSTGVVNSSAITLDSNTETLVILGEDDVAILSGDAPGEVVLRSVNLITGNTVGTHLILPGTFISNNFNISYGLGRLTILPATAQFTIATNSLTQVYNGEARSVGVTVVPADLEYTVTYNGSTTPPVNAGTYAVQVTVNDPNYVGSVSATMVVQKAPATATTGTYVINKGQALPAFTATYSGFLAGQTASVVTSTTFTLSPNYNGQAGVYQIIVNATAANYTFTSINGTLYVNPAGAGTKQVKPTFICFSNLNPPVNGFSKVAYFNYDNPNNTPVYIPVGPRNSVTATSFDGSELPSVFLPGVSAPIAIPYNGSSITWQITSNKNNGTTGSIPANSSNTVCTSPGVKNLVMEEELPELTPELRVYPNPSAGRVFLEFIGGDASAGDLEVYSALGVRCAVQPVRIADQLMELDLSALGAGMYIIKYVTEGHLSSTRVIIE